MIYCNNFALPITSNPFCLLSRLRQTKCNCWIWANAICPWVDWYQTKHLVNLRFWPLFPKAFRFVLVGSEFISFPVFKNKKYLNISLLSIPPLRCLAYYLSRSLCLSCGRYTMASASTGPTSAILAGTIINWRPILLSVFGKTLNLICKYFPLFSSKGVQNTSLISLFLAY